MFAFAVSKQTMNPMRRLFTTNKHKVLSKDFMNKAILRAEYAPRGAIVSRALELKAEGNRVIMTNIGNPQEVGTLPMTFVRQVLACVVNPSLLDEDVFPVDVRERARTLLNGTPAGSIGAYTHSQGMMGVRESVAQFILERDSFPADPNDIFLLDGASPGIKNVLQLLISKPTDTIMCPIPQYPLYSASIAAYNGTMRGYHLHEETGWSLNVDELRKNVLEARSEGLSPKAMVVINPGNPTGRVLSMENIHDVIQMCEEERLVILADEVYQENIYDEEKFHSFKKTVRQSDSHCELISFHTVSKGVLGECGMRGGYMELTNIEKAAKEQLYKLASICLCPNTIGQSVVDIMVNPPKPGDASYALFKQEHDDRLSALRRRAKMVSHRLNDIPGIECQDVHGAMYAFPRITLPAKAIAHSKDKLHAPDFDYCMELLNQKKVCVIPGSGFGQEEGTLHFRTTILPPDDDLEYVCTSIEEFHKEYTARFS